MVSTTVTFDSAYGSLPTPRRFGYTFEGWYTSGTGGTRITSSTIVKTPNNHTLYAHWERKQITVYFDATDGYVSQTSKTVTVLLEYGSLPSPNERSSYDFDGWYYGGNRIYSSTTVNTEDNHTLYAHWSLKYSECDCCGGNSYTCPCYGSICSTCDECEYHCDGHSSGGISGGGETSTYTCLCNYCDKSVSTEGSFCSDCSHSGWCSTCYSSPFIGVCNDHCPAKSGGSHFWVECTCHGCSTPVYYDGLCSTCSSAGWCRDDSHSYVSYCTLHCEH